MKARQVRVRGIAVVLALAVVACGGGSDEPNPTTPQGNGGTASAPGTTVAPSTTQPVSSGRAGTATVTLGGETWEFGDFACLSELVDFDFAVIAVEGDMYLDMRIEDDDNHLIKFGDFAGEGWESTARVVVDGRQVSASGDFRHLDTGELEPGTVSGTCP